MQWVNTSTHLLLNCTQPLVFPHKKTEAEEEAFNILLIEKDTIGAIT